jgi:hypothetical protein
MSEYGVQSSAESSTGESGLTQWQRVTSTFTAPSKTFDDIQRGHRSWWLPLILASLASYLFFFAIVQRIGIEQAVENQYRLSPRTEERLSQLTAEQRESVTRASVETTRWMLIVNPLVGMASAAILALGLMGTINFVFGGRAQFGSVFSVVYYAWLPQSFKALLGTVVIYAGMAPESFNLKNYAPTNLGAFLDPLDTNRALYSLASSLDLVTIWMLVLLGMGIAAVAGTKRSSGYIAVFGWWAFFVLVSVGWTAAMG